MGKGSSTLLSWGQALGYAGAAAAAGAAVAVLGALAFLLAFSGDVLTAAVMVLALGCTSLAAILLWREARLAFVRARGQRTPLGPLSPRSAPHRAALKPPAKLL